MKKSLVVTISMLMMLVPILFATGCATNSKPASMDWYSEVPRAKHEVRFPHGHEQSPSSKKLNCVFDPNKDVYICQFE